MLLASCASPTQRIENRATDLGLQRFVAQGSGYRHLLFFHGGKGDVLHVYLDHDGTPWETPTRVARDPTPRHPVMLEWMRDDPAPSLYLGRPCYYGLDTTPPCVFLLWTSERYSPAVVQSMTGALTRFLAQHPYPRIAFLGYSGGGALAVLMAQHVPATAAVVTVAGNLDSDGWASLHGYAPLHGSDNPLARAPLAQGVVQLHYAGGRDTQVPLSLSRGYVARHPEATLVEMPQYDHVCCWRELWPQVLRELECALEPRFNVPAPAPVK